MSSTAPVDVAVHAAWCTRIGVFESCRPSAQVRYCVVVEQQLVCTARVLSAPSTVNTQQVIGIVDVQPVTTTIRPPLAVCALSRDENNR